MLSDQEKANIVDLLNLLNLDDLFDLAKTATTGIINAQTREDALKIILQHQLDSRALLNRKKITKSLLFKYLHDKGVPFSASIDKAKLIDVTLKFWKQYPRQLQILPAGDPNCTRNDNLSISSRSENNTVNNDGATNYSSSNNENALALKFSEWFFLKLNEYVTKRGEAESLVKDDFWNESTASVHLIASDNKITYDAQGGESIVDLFINIQNEHNLFFSPNLSSFGTRGKAEMHGMVLVLSCGTLHKSQSECVGIFEQMFLLMKDPLGSDNWKIKKTELILRSQQNVNQQPQLPPDDSILKLGSQ